MSYIFGDGFDPYTTNTDIITGYWDGGTAGGSLVAGRFAGSRAYQMSTSGTGVNLFKTSGVNDAIHHVVFAYNHTASLAGTGNGHFIQFCDGATVQCSVTIRADGAMLFYSGAHPSTGGSPLATYATAVTALNTWTAFEIEVVISNTVGAFRVRKNGNTTNDFDSGAALNTRGGTANNYANRLNLGWTQNLTPITCQTDDLLWRSDATSLTWLGDIRCFTRMPASDASAQFARAPNPYMQTIFTTPTTNSIAAGTARYTSFTAAYDGTIGTATVSLGTGYTGNLKCSIFASSGSAPTTVVGSASVLVNPANGVNTITFGTPVTVTKNTQYWIGVVSDTSSGTWLAAGTAGVQSATSYASFPVASPAITTSNPSVTSSVTITSTTNYQMVNETLQDGTTSYVYDSTAGDADFYNLGTLSPNPVTVHAVTTRGFVAKSDAGTRTGAMQIKSGATTVASPTLTLSSSFGWTWRTDALNPNGAVAWTAAAVDAVQIGPTVIS